MPMSNERMGHIAVSLIKLMRKNEHVSMHSDEQGVFIRGQDYSGGQLYPTCQFFKDVEPQITSDEMNEFLRLTGDQGRAWSDDAG
jgi:hypothetical protein